MKYKEIEIDLGDSKRPDEVAMALRDIAEKVENGYYSGIVGWSDVSWSVKIDEDGEDGTDN